MLNNIIIFGSPGSGKSTISQYLMSNYGFNYLCIGDELRSIVKENSVLGNRVKNSISKGKLASDDIVFDIVAAKTKNLNNFILDGFPRNRNQCDYVLKLNIDAVLYLGADYDVVKSRMLDRHRKDDVENTINDRLEIYENITLPILSFFENRDIKIFNINANKSLEKIYVELNSVFGKVESKVS